MKRLLVAACLLMVACVTPAPPPAGPVTPPASAKAADGAACLAAADCESGICEGQGCDAGSPGKCAPRKRPCTMDYREYCGCDGKIFHGSGSCPGQRFQQRDGCPE
jgi:hypothetical protein